MAKQKSGLWNGYPEKTFCSGNHEFFGKVLSFVILPYMRNREKITLTTSIAFWHYRLWSTGSIDTKRYRYGECDFDCSRTKQLAGHYPANCQRPNLSWGATNCNTNPATSFWFSCAAREHKLLLASGNTRWIFLESWTFLRKFKRILPFVYRPIGWRH